MGKRKYVKRKMGANPLVFSFRQKANPDHRRTVRGHHIDDTPIAWAVHTHVVTPGRAYVRHMTEWFEKSMWQRAEPKVMRRRAYTEQKPFVAPVASLTPTEEPPPPPPRPTKESPKNAPPPITFVDDDDDTDEIPVVAVAPPVREAPKSDPMDINSELPTEYNPRAHKENVAGSPEDLVVFDALVDSNFIAQQRQNKLMALRARQQGRVLKVSPNNPIVSGFEPG